MMQLVSSNLLQSVRISSHSGNCFVAARKPQGELVLGQIPGGDVHPVIEWPLLLVLPERCGLNR